MPSFTDPNLLVGIAAGDDAAVYKMSGDMAVILTVDFFPPIVDDPFAFGQVAVANALSDVYAMGGKPLLALNIVAFPVDLPREILGRILKGGASKAREAGVLIVGGHTVDDKEPKYGLAVTGIIEPGLQVTNAGARVGDVLVLTKPIGTGIITTAGKQRQVRQKVLDQAVEVMETLNRASSEAMMRVGVNACSDITGFGLLGHLRGMVEGSKVGARVSFSEVPLLEGVQELIDEGIAPGGTRRNLESVDGLVKWHSTIDESTRLLLCDAQTSGGLLISVPVDKRDQLLKELEAAGVETRAVVGEIVALDSLDGRRIEVLP